MFGSGQRLDRLSDTELAQLFLTVELSLTRGQSVRDLVNPEYSKARIPVSFHHVSMLDIRAFKSDLQSWFGERPRAGKIVVTGEGIPTAYLATESIREISLGILVSIVLSALVVGLYFRNAMIVLAIVGATIVPILAGFGLWGWFGPEIGMAAVLVVAITIGIVVDDTIHLSYRFIDGVQNLDLEAWGAASYAMHKVGAALMMTSVTLALGLLVLSFSGFSMNSTFGVCSALIIFIAFLYSVSIAPRTLVLVGKGRDERARL
ncbi:MAG: efflux RND transporter permease subunit [Pseudomonadales bacterium]